MRFWCLSAVVFGTALACGGFGNAPDDVVQALTEDDFALAETLLQQRLDTAPDDARNNRLMGDLCLRRVQAFPRVAAKNQSRAIDSYRRAVEVEPTNCEYWNRLALAVAGGMTDDETRFDPAAVAKLPLREGHDACEGSALLFLESYQQPTAAEVSKLREKLGAEATNEALQLERFPSVRLSYNAAGLESLGWQTVVKAPTPDSGKWFVVTRPPQTASGLSGARDRKITSPEAGQILKTIGSNIAFVDYGHGATLSTKGFVPASSCPGNVSWRISSGNGTPIGYCTKGRVKSGARHYRAATLTPADESHWSEQSMRRSLLNPAAARDAECVGGIVDRMLEHEASCQITYRQAVTSERSLERKQIRVAADMAHAERVLSAVNGSIVYGEKVAKELGLGRVAKGLPYTLFLKVPSEIEACTGRTLMQGIVFSDDYETVVTRCTADGFEFDFEGMAISGWRRGRE